jgi:hypothetical protein
MLQVVIYLCYCWNLLRLQYTNVTSEVIFTNVNNLTFRVKGGGAKSGASKGSGSSKNATTLYKIYNCKNRVNNCKKSNL